MNVTKEHLKQIIEEELLEMMNESAFGGLGAVAGRMAVDLDRSTPGGISDKMRRTRKRTDNIVKYRTDGRFDHTTGHPTQPEDGKAPFQHGKSTDIDEVALGLNIAGQANPELRKKVKKALEDEPGGSRSSGMPNPLKQLKDYARDWTGNVDRGYYDREKAKRAGKNAAAARRDRKATKTRERGNIAHNFGGGVAGSGMTGGYSTPEPRQTFGEPAATTKVPRKKKRYTRIPADLESAVSGKGKSVRVPIDENDITKADLKKVIREELEAFLDNHYSK